MRGSSRVQRSAKRAGERNGSGAAHDGRSSAEARAGTRPSVAHASFWLAVARWCRRKGPLGLRAQRQLDRKDGAEEGKVDRRALGVIRPAESAPSARATEDLANTAVYQLATLWLAASTIPPPPCLKCMGPRTARADEKSPEREGRCVMSTKERCEYPRRS